MAPSADHVDREIDPPEPWSASSRCPEIPTLCPIVPFLVGLVTHTRWIHGGAGGTIEHVDHDPRGHYRRVQHRRRASRPGPRAGTSPGSDARRRFVSITHPDYVDHVLHQARLGYVKSNEYEPIRAAAGINLLTDEGDSWAGHRTALNPTFARRHLNTIVDLMIDPIERATDELTEQGDGVQFDMHAAMVETRPYGWSPTRCSARISARSCTACETSRRVDCDAPNCWPDLGLLGPPRPVYDAIATSTFSGSRCPTRFAKVSGSPWRWTPR